MTEAFPKASGYTQPLRVDFYVWMAAACTVIVFATFVPTYWFQLAAGTFVGPPLLHLHAALFFGWTLLLLSQSALAANGRLDHHRAWGLAAISLATAMVAVGLLAALNTVARAQASGSGDQARAFLIVQVSTLGLFAGFFIAAVVSIQRRHPEAHKRFILLATISLLNPAIARIFFLLATGGGPGLRPGLGPPLPVGLALIPGLIGEVLIVAGVIYDWRIRGRPHPVWLVGAALMTGVMLMRGPLSTTPAWQAIASALTHMGG